MKTRSSLQWVVVALVAGMAGALGFWSLVVAERTVLAKGVLIVAQEGAQVQVVGDSLRVLAGSADRARFSPAFPYVAGGVYLVLVSFALVGAAGLFRPVERSGKSEAPS